VTGGEEHVIVVTEEEGQRRLETTSNASNLQQMKELEFTDTHTETLKEMGEVCAGLNATKEPQEDQLGAIPPEPSYKSPHSKAFATLDAILTIVGECYGQRDLLGARDWLWEVGGMS